MREVVSIFQEGFAIGLRKNKAIANTSQCLSECYNMVITKEGLFPREVVYQPFMNIGVFPFPILYIGSNSILYFTENSLYKVVGEWELLLLYSLEDKTWGGKPHVADFQTYLVWSTPNGTWQLQEDVVTKLDAWSGETCCNFRQQLLMGEAVLPKGPERGVDGTINGASVEIPTVGTVAWGIIGDTEFRYQLGQENGWITLPFIGKVLAVIPMGERVYVYHQNGIYRLTPVNEPVPTFGALEFGDIGPLNRDCVAGDSNAHLMLGTNRRLYLILPERTLSDQGRFPVELDYQEFMEQLVEPVVTFDSVKKQWWIGDSERCFLFSGTGLSEVSFTPSSLGNYNGQLLGCGVAHGSDEARVTINTTSLSARGIKTLMTVEADIRAEEAYGRALWRTNFSNPLKPEQWKRIDPRGFFFPVVAGSEVQVGIKTNDYKTTHLSKLWLRYKVTDRTSTRGIANPGAIAE